MRIPGGKKRSGSEYGQQELLHPGPTGQTAGREENSEIVITSIFSLFLLPFKLMLLILKLLFFIGGWGMIITGYCAVLGIGLMGLAELWSGAAHLAGGLGASLFGFGSGFFALGLALLAWMLTHAAAGGFIRMASGRSRISRNPSESAGSSHSRNKRSTVRGTAKLTLILLGAGLLTGGLGLLAGGTQGIELPALPFLDSDGAAPHTGGNS